MTLCPIALVVGCEKCPALSICPLKTVLGNAPTPRNAPANVEPPAGETKTGTRPAGKRGRSRASTGRRHGRHTAPSPVR